MNNEFEKIWGERERGGGRREKKRETQWLHLRNQPDIFLEAPPSRDL
jgi:hypothetical protein